MKLLLILLWVMVGMAMPSALLADLTADHLTLPGWFWFVFIDLLFALVFLGFAGLWWNIFGSVPGCS